MWSNLAYLVAGLGAVAVLLGRRDASRARLVTGAFGILALPLGLPALYAALRD